MNIRQFSEPPHAHPHREVLALKLTLSSQKWCQTACHVCSLLHRKILYNMLLILYRMASTSASRWSLVK